MFTRDRFQLDPVLSWNGPFLFTRHRSAYQRQATRDRSVMVRSKKSSCFMYQLSMRIIHVEAFKMAPKKAKSIEEGDKAFSWTDNELSLIDFKPKRLGNCPKEILRHHRKVSRKISFRDFRWIIVLTAIWRMVSCLKAVKPRSMPTKTTAISLLMFC